MDKVKAEYKMDDVRVSLTNSVNREIRSLISEQLDAYNDQVTGSFDNVPLDVHLIDRKDDQVLGGLVGRTSLGVLFVDMCLSLNRSAAKITGPSY